MKKYIYIGIMSNDVDNNDIKFVHKIQADGNIAYWKSWTELRDEKLEALKFKHISSAESIVEGLTLNGYVAFLIKSPIEIK